MAGSGAPLEEAWRLFDAFVLTVVKGGESGVVQSKHNEQMSHNDAVIGGIFTLCILFLMLALRFLILKPVAALIIRGSATQQLKNREKFAQSEMEALMYGFFTFAGVRIVLRQPWIWPSSAWWIGLMDGSHQSMGADLKCYYILYAARYLASFCCVLLEHRRKDFVQMISHHVVTFVLVCISWWASYHRIGSIVMVIFDPADVPLHIAKLFKYIGGIFEFGSDLFFGVFTLTWVITRNSLFPYVLWSATVESWRYIPPWRSSEWACVILLWILLALNLFWSWLLFKAVKGFVSGNHVKDERSDDESTEGQEDRSAKKKQ